MLGATILAGILQMIILTIYLFPKVNKTIPAPLVSLEEWLEMPL